MTLWNDKRTPPGVVTDTNTGQSGPAGSSSSKVYYPPRGNHTGQSTQEPLTQAQRLELLYPKSKYGAPGSKAPVPTGGGAKPNTKKAPSWANRTDPEPFVESPVKKVAKPKTPTLRTKPITKRVMPR